MEYPSFSDMFPIIYTFLLLCLLLFPTCQVRVVRFYVSLLLFLLLRLLLLLASSAGPQPRLSALSVPCRTSTARSNVRRCVRKNVRQNVSRYVRTNVIRDVVRDVGTHVGTLCSSGGFDEHRNSDSLEKVEALPGCSFARNHNSHAHVHAYFTFVRESLAPAALAQNRKLQEGTGDGFVQA